MVASTANSSQPAAPEASCPATATAQLGKSIPLAATLTAAATENNKSHHKLESRRELSSPGHRAAKTTSTRILVLPSLTLLVPHYFLAAMGLPSVQDWAASVEQLVTNAGPAGPLVFILIYAAAATLLIPGSILTLAAGYLFGQFEGTAIVIVAATLGASLSFLISRYLARPLMQRRLDSYPKFVKIDAGIAARGAYIVLLCRLSPLLPFGVLNYALGLTSVEFWPFVAASAVGMIPGTFAYVYLGNAGRVAASGGATATKLVLYAVGGGGHPGPGQDHRECGSQGAGGG